MRFLKFLLMKPLWDENRLWMSWKQLIGGSMTNLSDMRKKIDAMRLEREAWTARMRQIDADREVRKLNAKKLL